MVKLMNARHRGLFLADALLGTMIAVMVITSVIVVVTSQQRCGTRFAQSRHDVRTVESALIQMQAGGQAPAGVSIRKIDLSASPAGWVWVEATSGGAVLHGLVPVESGAK